MFDRAEPWANADSTVLVNPDRHALRAALAVSIPEHPDVGYRISFGDQFREASFQNEVVRWGGQQMSGWQLIQNLAAALVEHGWSAPNLKNVATDLASSIVA